MIFFLSKHLERLDLLGLGLGWDFFGSRLEKYRGVNWFAEISDKFPLPFNVVPIEFSGQLSTWIELIGAIALLIGLSTRFIASVHWPAAWSTLAELAQGYVLTDQGHGNFKLPLIFLSMLLPLTLLGPRRLSVDALIRDQIARRRPHAALEKIFAPHSGLDRQASAGRT